MTDHESREYFGDSFHNAEYCFVHIPKTAGISILSSLANEVVFEAPAKQNLQRAIIKRNNRRLTIIGHDNRSDRNMTLARFSKLFLGELFTAGFVRNPFDRFVSAYEYLRAGGMNKYDLRDNVRFFAGQRYNFESFVHETIAPNRNDVLSQMHFRPQFKWVCSNDGRLLLDFIGRFENLNEHFRKLCMILGVSHRPLLQLNKTQRRDYKSYYTAASRKIIEHTYRDDLRLFEYDYLSCAANKGA